MTTKFSEMLMNAAFDDDVLSVSISDGWMQGRTTYGGLSAALGYETARRSFPDLPPLRTAMVTFIGPAGGAVKGEARLLREGKSVTFVEADIIADQGLATRSLFGFGANRTSNIVGNFAQPHGQPGPDGLEPYIPEGMGPPFAQHFETRLAQGARPFSGSEEFDHYIWVRHKDKAATGIAALIALADMPPPAVLPMFSEFAPISSMSWMINVLTDNPETEDGWWLLQSRAEHASKGYTSQDMLVWNSDGELVIAGRQSVAIFG